MINIEEERKAFEIEWIKLGGDFKSFSIIDNMYVLIPSMASADDVIKEFAERAVNSAFALWLIQSRQKQVVIDDLNIQLKDAKAIPEGFVLLPIEPTKAIKTALSYQCFDFIKVAQVYRNLGFDIPKKAEDEQSFFLHKFLILAIKHGNDFIKVFNAETKAMIEAQEQSHD